MSDLSTFEPFTREGRSLMFRPFDVGMYNFFKLYIAGKPVPKIFAPPERALESLSKIHDATSGGPKPVLGSGKGNFPLPAISITRTDFTLNTAKYSSAKVRRPVDSKVTTEDGKAVLTYQYPIPYDITYQIDLWAIYEYDINDLLEQTINLQNRFRFMTVPVDLGGHLRVQNFTAEFDSFSNNIEVETGETERILRYSLTIRLAAWFWRNDQKFTPMVLGGNMTITIEHGYPEPEKLNAKYVISQLVSTHKDTPVVINEDEPGDC